jgi:hypothetical protein
MPVRKRVIVYISSGIPGKGIVLENTPWANFLIVSTLIIAIRND